MQVNIKTAHGLIKYDRATNFSMQEGVLLSGAIKEAFTFLNTSFSQLKNGKVDEEIISTLFADDENVLPTLSKLITKLKNGTLSFKREKIYANTDGTSDEQVLASVAKDTSRVVKVFDSFFSRQIKDNRAGVVIHEAAHLLGLEGEENLNDESASLQSAEAIKNFCLCVNGKLTLDQIKQEPEQTSNPNAKELTSRPNPNRTADGKFDFGPDQGTSTPSKDVDNKSKNSSLENKSSYKADSAKIMGVTDKRKSNGKEVELENAVKFRPTSFGMEAWLGISLGDKDKIYKPGEDVGIVAEIAFEKKDSDVMKDPNEEESEEEQEPPKIESTQVLFEEKANEKNEITLNRLAITKIHSRRDEIQREDLELMLYTIPKEITDKIKTSQASTYEKYEDENNAKPPITRYPESHYNNSREGKITNFDEVKDEIHSKGKLIYKRKIYIDLIKGESKKIE